MVALLPSGVKTVENIDFELTWNLIEFVLQLIAVKRKHLDIFYVYASFSRHFLHFWNQNVIKPIIVSKQTTFVLIYNRIYISL